MRIVKAEQTYEIDLDPLYIKEMRMDRMVVRIKYNSSRRV